MTTKDKNTQDDWLIKLSGKAALPKPLEIGHNYKIEIEGSITEKRKRTERTVAEFILGFLSRCW